MAWELEIHIIDVGQGESSLIIASNEDAAPPNNFRAMLIDGGSGNKARTVDAYVKSALERKYLSRIVTTHYDNDHSGGIANILIAENLHILAYTLAQAAGKAAYNAAEAGKKRLKQISAAAAAAYAAGSGAYNDKNGHDRSGIATNAGVEGQELPSNIREEMSAATKGVALGEDFITGDEHNLNAPLIANEKLRREVATVAGLNAGREDGNAMERLVPAYQSIHNSLADKIEIECDFRTEGRYGRANILDVGDFTNAPKDKYKNAIRGIFSIGQNKITVPANRIRQSVNLGDEILWNSGNNAMPAPPGAPAVYVVAARSYVRDDPAGVFMTGTFDNRISMGLIIRFNNFFYFTGGDLPYEGENRMLAFLLGRTNVPFMPDNTLNPVVAVGFNDPNNPPLTFPVPTHICCFKASHHGAAESTSDYFVANMNSRAAFISAGKNDSYKHPAQTVIDRLHNSQSIREFYLTNCSYPRTHVPGFDPAIDQIAQHGNKSRVAGDNNLNNLAADRERGNINILVNEAESLSATHPPAPLAAGAVHHSFRVLYWDRTNQLTTEVTTVRHNH
ncbi:MAG TPA: hypothetical protein VJ810_12035 [Blastocatellia bacterium]|nr:hypothetical protein [Blastocatellia bacterium]